jgi:redox-sensitive bicupin YhaK (pirin superfamily)
VRGKLSVNGEPLFPGDAALLEDVATLKLDHGQGAEVIVFDLAP